MAGSVTMSKPYAKTASGGPCPCCGGGGGPWTCPCGTYPPASWPCGGLNEIYYVTLSVTIRRYATPAHTGDPIEEVTYTFEGPLHPDAQCWWGTGNFAAAPFDPAEVTVGPRNILEGDTYYQADLIAPEVSWGLHGMHLELRESGWVLRGDINRNNEADWWNDCYVGTVNSWSVT